MKKNLQTRFSTRQYMLSRDFEIYYYKDSALSGVDSHSHDYYEFYFFLEGDVSIEIAGRVFPLRYGDVILIPQSATTEIQDKKFVYVVQPDSTVKYTEISISPLNDGQNFIVTSGLNSGDRIVTEGVQTLSDGRKIVPITEAQKQAKYQQAVEDQREGNLETAFK